MRLPTTSTIYDTSHGITGLVVTASATVSVLCMCFFGWSRCKKSGSQTVRHNRLQQEEVDAHEEGQGGAPNKPLPSTDEKAVARAARKARVSRPKLLSRDDEAALLAKVSTMLMQEGAPASAVDILDV